MTPEAGASERGPRRSGGGSGCAVSGGGHGISEDEAQQPRRVVQVCGGKGMRPGRDGRLRYRVGGHKCMWRCFLGCTRCRLFQFSLFRSEIPLLRCNWAIAGQIICTLSILRLTYRKIPFYLYEL